MTATALFDAAPDALIALTRDWRVARANAAAHSLLGYARLDERPLDELLVPGERARLEHIDARRAAGWALPETMRVRFVRADGSTLHAEVLLGAASADGDVLRVLSARDFSRVERAEGLMARLALLGESDRALEGPDALLDAGAPVFEALGWTVAFTEAVAGGSITHRVLSRPDDPVGAYGRSIVGVFKAEHETPVFTQIVRERRPLFLDNLPSLTPGQAAGARALSESMLAARVARSAWCPIFDDDRVRFVLSVTGRDLSEHDFVAVQLFAAEIGAALRLRRAHEALLARERLAALGEMAAVVAHEVRNPIAALLLSAETLRRSPGHTGLLDTLVEEAMRLRHLSADLLAFGSPATPHFETVEIDSILQETVATVRADPACEANAPRVEIHVEPGARAVCVDKQIVRRALVNLVYNAFEHVTPGGRVTLNATRENGLVRIRVWNEGEPLRPEVAARVFEPFFTTRASGTGLGLAIAKRAAIDLTGSMSLDDTDSGVGFSLRVRAADD